MEGEHNLSDDGSSELPRPIEALSRIAKTDISRRRVCQVFGIAGASSLAGCGDQESQLKETEQPSNSNTPVARSDVEMDPNITGLIEEHTAQLAGLSYTVGLEYQGANTAPDITKQFEYLREAGRDAPVAIIEESTSNDGVSDMLHYLDSNLRAVEIALENGSRSATELGAPTTIPEITGAVVYDEFLLGAELSEPDERQGESTDNRVIVYGIETHRRLDLDEGEVEVNSDGVIQSFELSWRDNNENRRWIEVEIRDIGVTTVETPNT